MSQASKPPLTPSQTVGPYFALGLTLAEHQFTMKPLVSSEIHGQGQPISITGRVLDGAGRPVDDAMLEIVQADASGRLDNDGFAGFARADTSLEPANSFTFRTVKPEPLRDGEAPYICVIVFMRGMLLHACTRIYFADEEANLNDPVFSRLPEDRRDTLLARRLDAADHGAYQFDIHMQGERETLFFKLPNATNA